MRAEHIYENIALTAFLILLATEVVGVSYVTFYVYVNANEWLLNTMGLLRNQQAWPAENVTRFADVNVSAVPQYFVEYPGDYRFVVDEPGTCRQQQQREPFVVLIVPVNPSDRAARDVIRATWGSETRRPVAGKTVSLLFLLGLPTGDGAERVQRRVLEESAEHGDLLQAEFLDSYRNLTIKTMVMMEWLESRCPGASYAMKVDTDAFLNVRNLVDMLSTAPGENYMTGAIMRRSWAHRDANSKWYLPREVFPESHYPPYVAGVGYVLSLDMPGKLVEASRHVKAVYMEDVYLGLCMEHLGIRLTEPPRWSMFPTSVLYSLCSYSKIVLATIHPPHLDTAIRMSFWEDFKRLVAHC